jgi:hypothetical protein
MDETVTDRSIVITDHCVGDGSGHYNFVFKTVMSELNIKNKVFS